MHKKDKPTVYSFYISVILMFPLFLLLDSDKAKVKYPANACHCWLLSQSKWSLANPQSFLLQRRARSRSSNTNTYFSSVVLEKFYRCWKTRHKSRVKQSPKIIAFSRVAQHLQWHKLWRSWACPIYVQIRLYFQYHQNKLVILKHWLDQVYSVILTFCCCSSTGLLKTELFIKQWSSELKEKHFHLVSLKWLTLKFCSAKDTVQTGVKYSPQELLFLQ